jgi:hypothetical protein
MYKRFKTEFGDQLTYHQVSFAKSKTVRLFQTELTFLSTLETNLAPHFYSTM